MAIDEGLGTNQGSMAEMGNKWMLLPKIMHILLAHRKNKSLIDISKDPETIRTVLYTMSHHVYDYGYSNIAGHPYMSHVYNVPADISNLARGQFSYVLAALYITKIVNASLTTTYLYNDKIDVRKR